MTFGNWRKQLRLLESIARLGEGSSVTEVAFEAGYRSPSAFTAMFHQALGRLPSDYLKRGRPQAGRRAPGDEG